MSAIDTQRLCEKAAAYGVDISAAAPRLAAYAQMLVEYNKKVNLTAITDAEGIEDRHFIDSLLLASQPEVAGSLVDVGTGAGFPGIVAKLYKPQLALTLMEPTGKRVDFLRYVCGQLGIAAEFAKERAEEAARKRWRETFDVASARCGIAASAAGILPAACKKRRAVYCHEGCWRCAGGAAGTGRRGKAGREICRQAGFYIARRQRPQPVVLRENIANSAGLPQKRRKNCKSTAEVTVLLSKTEDGNNWKLKCPRGMLSFEEGPRGLCVPPCAVQAVQPAGPGAVKKEEHT